MNGLNTSDSEYKGLIENAFQHLDNFKQTYTNSAIAHKKKLISSIFPEKIEFDGKKCRTTRINDVLRYILQIDKELDKNKKGQISKKYEFVPCGGVGENRTLVQTSNQIAFYTLSLFLGFRL